MIRTIVGKVDRVSVTGAFAVVDGWHVPMAHVLRTDRATVEQLDTYLADVERARREADGHAARVSDMLGGA